MRRLSTATLKLGLVLLIAGAALTMTGPPARAFQNNPCTRACVNTEMACVAGCKGLTGAALFACTLPCIQAESACISKCD
jgi:hypothetical protein